MLATLAPLQNTLANVPYMWIGPPQLKGYRPWTNLEVLCIRQHPCCCKSSASMTLWTPVRSTASVEPGGWSQQACSTGVGASTTTTAGADSAAWRRMMVAARPALVALPLGSSSSWSWRSWHGQAPCQGSVSSCWRSPEPCATALMWKRWALIRITILRQRPMLWGLILSPHQRSIPPWPRNPSLQQSKQHNIAQSQQAAVSHIYPPPVWLREDREVELLMHGVPAAREIAL